MTTTRANQSGLTLIEIMIAMAVGSLLIGMIFAIYTKMSVAYRSQSRVTEVNQTVRAAAAMIARDVAVAGIAVPDSDQPDDELLAVSPNNGIAYWSPGTGPCGSSDLPAFVCPNPVRPLYVTNAVQFTDESASAGDPDQLFLYGADTTVAGVVDSLNVGSERIEMDAAEAAKFADDEVVVLVRTATADATNGADGGAANSVWFSACLLEVTTAHSDHLHFDNSSPFNRNSMNQCQNVIDSATSTALSGNYQPNGLMLYKFYARGYRIDPSSGNEGYGVLQVSRTGGLQNDWEDIALGITNLQFATQYYEAGDTTDRDGDGDPELDWYSGDNMVHPHADRPSNAAIRSLSISVEGRTTSETDSVGTTQTPAFGGGDYDMTGDFGTGYDLTTGTQPARYQGNHVYRWATTRVDIRNSAVGN